MTPTNTSDNNQWRRGFASPLEGTISLIDDVEKRVLDLDGGGTAHRLDGVSIKLVLGGHDSITLDVRSEINDSLESLESQTFSADDVVDLDDIGVQNVASEHIRITATGSNGSPSENGAVIHQTEYSIAV